MNENLPRWIWASVTKHFDQYRQNILLRFQGFEELAEQQDNFYLRTVGPYFKELTKNEFAIHLNINILVTSIRDDKDAHKVHRQVGIIGQGFTNQIKVYKYGDDATKLIGCFKIISSIDILHYGPLEDTKNILQSTIEADYEMQIGAIT